MHKKCCKLPNGQCQLVRKRFCKNIRGKICTKSIRGFTPPAGRFITPHLQHSIIIFRGLALTSLCTLFIIGGNRVIIDFNLRIKISPLLVTSPFALCVRRVYNWFSSDRTDSLTADEEAVNHIQLCLEGRLEIGGSGGGGDFYFSPKPWSWFAGILLSFISLRAFTTALGVLEPRYVPWRGQQIKFYNKGD